MTTFRVKIDNVWIDHAGKRTTERCVFKHLDLFKLLDRLRPERVIEVELYVDDNNWYRFCYGQASTLDAMLEQLIYFPLTVTYKYITSERLGEPTKMDHRELLEYIKSLNALKQKEVKTWYFIMDGHNPDRVNRYMEMHNICNRELWALTESVIEYNLLKPDQTGKNHGDLADQRQLVFGQIYGVLSAYFDRLDINTKHYYPAEWIMRLVYQS